MGQGPPPHREGKGLFRAPPKLKSAHRPLRSWMVQGHSRACASGLEGEGPWKRFLSGRLTTPQSCAGVALGPKGWRARSLRARRVRHPEATSHRVEGMKRSRHASWTGQDGQEEKAKSAKCEEERKDGRRERGGSDCRKEKAGGAQQAGVGGTCRQRVGSSEPRRFIFKSSRCLRVK